MASEAVLGAIRIGSNYTRQAVALVLGIVLVALLVRWLGTEAYGLTMLITATVGLASLIEDVVRGSLIRELGAAYHSGDRDRFRQIYDSAWLISVGGAVVALISFGAAYLILPELSIPEELLGAARYMLVLEGLYTCLYILVSPACNMLLVREMFIADNLWQIARRVGQFAVAAVLYKAGNIEGVAARLEAYYLGYTVISLVLLVAVIGLIMYRSRSCRPRPWRATRPAVREILGTIGWYSAMNIALNVHERIPAFILNAYFGLQANAIYGFGIVLASYVRMLTVGVNSGLDAVAARVVHRSSDLSLTRFIRAYTMLHAATAVPGAVALLVVGGAIVQVWIGGSVDNPEELLPAVVTMLPLLVIPVLLRSISDCWIRILYGAGFVRRIAPTILMGLLVNPVLGLLLYAILPAEQKIYGPVIGMGAAFAIFHFVLLPARGAAALGLRTTDLLRPTLRPLAAGVAAAPILVMARFLVEEWNVVSLGLWLAAYGAGYTLGCVWLTPRADREVLASRFRRFRLRRRPEAAAAPVEAREVEPEAESVVR